MKGRLIIFCGIPGSGKTTIAGKVAERLPKVVLVQTDVVRGMLGHPNYGADESRFVYDGCIAVAREALRNGYTVLLDGTFMREEYRSKARNELRKHSSRVDVVYVACGIETALRRNGARKAHVPADKVRSIHRRFEAPRRALRIDSTQLHPREAGILVLESLF
jgi:predicted kinase